MFYYWLGQCCLKKIININHIPRRDGTLWKDLKNLNMRLTKLMTILLLALFTIFKSDGYFVFPLVEDDSDEIEDGLNPTVEDLTGPPNYIEPSPQVDCATGEKIPELECRIVPEFTQQELFRMSYNASPDDDDEAGKFMKTFFESENTESCTLGSLLDRNSHSIDLDSLFEMAVNASTTSSKISPSVKTNLKRLVQLIMTSTADPNCNEFQVETISIVRRASVYKRQKLVIWSVLPKFFYELLRKVKNWKFFLNFYMIFFSPHDPLFKIELGIEEKEIHNVADIIAKIISNSDELKMETFGKLLESFYRA